MLPAGLPSSRRESIRFYRVLLGKAAEKGPEALRQARRWLCRNDLFYLLTVPLHRKDMNRDWIFARCREVQGEPNGHLDLWAREHYKSTIITWGLTIQDILASHGDGPEERYAGREITVGIFSHTRPIAKGFLIQIKREFEDNEDLKALFPDVLWAKPESEAPKWSEDGGIIVRRKTNPKESTVEAWGLVDGQPTGKHFFVRVYDDVVTRESVYTPEQIKKTTEAWELSDNLGSEDGWVRTIGTRYHAHDTYKTMMDRKVAVPRIHTCTRDGIERFEPDNCVLMKPETLVAKRRAQGVYTFAAQMLQNPTADKAQGFREEWLRYWDAASAAGMNVYLLVDPSSGKRRAERGVDNDYTSMIAIGLTASGHYRVLDMVRDRLNPTERIRRLFEMHRKWKPIRVGYEEYGLAADVHHIGVEQEGKNYPFEIVTLAGRVPKPDRIRRLVPLCENGLVWLPRTCMHQDWEGAAYDATRLFVDEEYLTFPVCRHDDMLDCLARILDDEMQAEWPKEPPEKVPDWVREAMADAASGRHDWQTA
jgi:predicted phage terminase large subunit-like protein